MKLLKKFNLLVILALLVCIFGLNISNTYAWFSSDKSAALIAKVAASDDIIKSVKVDNLDAPTKVIITKAKECTSNPIIYFELTGRLPYYVQHMNPIELNDKNVKIVDNKKVTDEQGNYIYEVPINVKVNLDEHNHFQPPFTPPGDVQGSINVKYLNNFISVPISGIKYTINYLNSMYGKKINKVSYSSSIQVEKEGLVKNAVIKELNSSNNPANSETPYIIQINTNKQPGIIYFEFTGELPYYVQHINPITVDNTKDTYEVPIYIKGDDLLSNVSSDISGEINIRYLNNTYKDANGKSIEIKYIKDNMKDARLFFGRDPEIYKPK